MKCQKCQNETVVSAVHGRVKTLLCMNCGTSAVLPINGKVAYKRVQIDLSAVCGPIRYQGVKLPAIR